MRSIYLIPFILLLTFSMAPETVQAKEGKLLYKERGCPGCHGPLGRPTVQSYPRLDGQNIEYCITQIKAIQKGSRQGGLSMIMKSNAAVKKLTSEEISGICKYLFTLR